MVQSICGVYPARTRINLLIGRAVSPSAAIDAWIASGHVITGALISAHRRPLSSASSTARAGNPAQAMRASSAGTCMKTASIAGQGNGTRRRGMKAAGAPPKRGKPRRANRSASSGGSIQSTRAVGRRQLRSAEGALHPLSWHRALLLLTLAKRGTSSSLAN